MESVKIYQIGVGSFGRYGFEKFIEMEKHLPEANVEIKGVCDKDIKKLERAEKFADVHGSSIETFTHRKEMYKHAEDEEGQVLVYDASSTAEHADNIYESLQKGFFHVSEKPSSVTREQHLEEKRLAQNRDVKFLVDFIERENPVVKKTLELLEDEEIDKIQVFRENSMGLQKILHPVERAGVKGGDILDKMMHEIYTLDFLEEVNDSFELDLKDAEAEFFMPKDFDSEKLMSIKGGYTRSINEETATGMSHATLKNNTTTVELHSSWLGLSDSSRHAAKKFREEIGEEIFDREFVQGDGEKAYLYEDARFFIIEGTRKLAGDMLNEKLYDLEKQEEIETRDLLHDQLYRVLESAVLEAAGLNEADISEKEIDVFMEKIFDIRDECIENGEDFFDELEEANKKIDSLIIQDGKILENEESKTIAG